MTYTKPLFLVLFLPLTIIMYNILPQKHRWKVLLISSYIFFWSISSKLIVYLLATTLIIYAIGLWLNAKQEERNTILKETEKEEKKKVKAKYLKKQRIIVTLASLLLIGILVLLKYSRFLGTNINNLFELLNINIKLVIPRFAMPIGISFYTLQAVSYLVDVYKEKIKADKNLGRLALFISFFPQIMEGPICRYEETAASLYEGKKTTYKSLTFGLQRILFGLMKKVLIVDRVNPFILEVFNNYANYDGGIIALGMILYIGIKYMMSVAQERANLKKGAFAYIFGAILLAGATTILPIIISVGTGENTTINNTSNTSGVPSIGYRAEFEKTNLPESNYQQWLSQNYGL